MEKSERESETWGRDGQASQPAASDGSIPTQQRVPGRASSYLKKRKKKDGW